MCTNVKFTLSTLSKMGHTPAQALEVLKQSYAIDYKFSNECPELVLLKYNQLESPMHEPIVQECRGLILNTAPEHLWKVVLYPFNKFFNYGEPNAAPIDWLKASVMEKVDGSLMTLFFYQGKWRVATSGTPDADCPINDYDITFKDLFWTLLKTKVEDLAAFLECLPKNCSHMFELCTPYNRVVVQYPTSNLHYLGSRDLVMFKEGRDLWLSQQFPIKVYPLTSLEGCIKAAEELNPLENEGYVVWDGTNRIKVKSPAYIMLHHAKDVLSVKKMAEVIRRGECEEFVVAIQNIPELKKIFDDVNERYKNLIENTLLYWDMYSWIEDQKSFALAIKDIPQKSLLFSMKNHKISVKEAINKLLEKAYLKLLGLKE